MLEDPIQKPTIVTCGSFQLHFHENLFSRQKQQTTQLEKTNQHCLETLLNELFTLNPENNEQTINEYIKKRQISMI